MKKLVKCFKFQKVMFVVQILMIVITFISALSFMTQYANLFGLELPLNQSIIDFHNHMQNFNKTWVYLSIVSLVSIIAMFFLETQKRVADRFALIVMGIFIAIAIATAVYVIVNTMSLLQEYQQVDFTYIYLEAPELADYQLQFETFYLVFIVHIVAIITFIGYFVSLLLSHILYVKEKGEQNAQ